MKLQRLIRWFLVIFVAWTLVVFAYNKGYLTNVMFFDSTLGKIVNTENSLLQRFCRPLCVTASIKSGCYDDTQVINLKPSLPICAVYYTLDGTEPTEEGNFGKLVKVYGSETLTFYAINFLTGAKSEIVSETYLLPDMIDRMIINREQYDPILIREIKTEVSKLDSMVLKRLYTQNLKIKLIDNFADEATLKGYSIPKQALALYYDKFIYVLSNQHQFDGLISTYLHELGHAYDFSFRISGKTLSDQLKFQSFWHTESLALFPNMSYFNSSDVETFAQCFAFYYYSKSTRELLQLKAPLIYTYLDQVTKFTELDRLDFESTNSRL